MAQLTLQGYLTGPTDGAVSHLTDLSVVEVGPTPYLLGTTRYDGSLRSWDFHTGTLTVTDDHPYLTGPLLGGAPSIATITLGSETAVLTGGGTAGALQLTRFGASGTLDATTTLTGLPASFAGLQHVTSVELANGNQAIFGALAGQAGLASIIFDSGGGLLSHGVDMGSGTHPTSAISATAHVAVAGQNYLLSSNTGSNTLTTRTIAANGTLGTAQTISPEDGLWINAPTAMAATNVGGGGYVVLGAAGSGSLTVVEVGGDGSMTIRDHILDARDTRFGGVTSLDIITAGVHTYVVAGGADDGLSLFVLLEGGMLIPRAHIADTDDMGLANISAVAMSATGQTLDILAASASEAGVTHLRYDMGPPGINGVAAVMGGILTGSAGGDLLTGSATTDQISAGAGDDILRDGAGSDVMTGGTGADLFILSADGAMDMITDFTLGKDRLDLSLWPMLRDISQLRFNLRSDGMQVSYGDEVLIVQSADGAPIDYRLLTTTDLIGASRLSASLQPGFPGPPTPAPDPDGPPPPPEAPEPGESNPLAALLALTSGNRGTLEDAIGASPPVTTTVVLGTAQVDLLVGTGGADVILADAGNDQVQAGDGDDTVFGRAGDDELFGQSGEDTLYGDNGADTLSGGNGQDALYGGAGHDTLSGGVGDDLLFGGSGADTFVFDNGQDVIGDHSLGQDRIQLDPVLWTGLTSAADLLFVYGAVVGNDTVISFPDGHALTVNGIDDMTLLTDDIILF